MERPLRSQTEGGIWVVMEALGRNIPVPTLVVLAEEEEEQVIPSQVQGEVVGFQVEKAGR